MRHALFTCDYHFVIKLLNIPIIANTEKCTQTLTKFKIRNFYQSDLYSSSNTYLSLTVLCLANTAENINKICIANYSSKLGTFLENIDKKLINCKNKRIN